jgi:hypothetical protein
MTVPMIAQAHVLPQAQAIIYLSVASVRKWAAVSYDILRKGEMDDSIPRRLHARYPPCR